MVNDTSPEKLPSRLFGPIESELAESVVEITLDDEALKLYLTEFCMGFLTPLQLLYRIQSILECNAARIENPEVEGLDHDKIDEDRYGR